MIFIDEVMHCVKGQFDEDEIDLAVQYFNQGGFHPRVTDPERRKFIQWLEVRKATQPVVYRAPPDDQLSLFDELECTL